MTFKNTINKSRILPKVKIIQLSKFKDNRGDIYSIFDNSIRKNLLPKNLNFNHVKVTNRKKNVIVGIHYDDSTWKLMGCVKGKILHYTTCLDQKSKYKYLSEKNILTEKNYKLVLVPPGYGNSFYCYKDSTIIYCLAYDGNYIDAKSQYTLRYDSSKVKIRWPVKNPTISKRDKYSDS